jgi:hypothetical protein
MNKSPSSVPNIAALVALRRPCNGDIVKVEDEYKAFIFELGAKPTAHAAFRAGHRLVPISDVTQTGYWRLFVAWDAGSAVDAEMLLAMWQAPKVEDPYPGIIESIARTITDTRDTDHFNAEQALAAITHARSTLYAMELEVKRIVARKLPS